MEIAIAIFIGVWLIAASLISYFWLKHDYKRISDNLCEGKDNESSTDIGQHVDLSVESNNDTEKIA